jgi:hypothetical protein
VGKEEAEGLVPAGSPLYDEDAVTDRSERFIASEIIRDQVRALHGRLQRRAVDGGRAHARPSKCAAEQMRDLAGRRGGEGASAAEHMRDLAGRRGGSGGLPPTTPERRSPLPPQPAARCKSLH